jgi:hypothetical protein
VVAELAGASTFHLSRWKRGESPIGRRSRRFGGIHALLHGENPADQPEHEQFKEEGEASGDHLDEQLFHGYHVRS